MEAFIYVILNAIKGWNMINPLIMKVHVMIFAKGKGLLTVKKLIYKKIHTGTWIN